MKLKIDFVTNSSNVSYVICVPDNLTEEELDEVCTNISDNVENRENTEETKKEWKKILGRFFNSEQIKLKLWQSYENNVSDEFGVVFWEAKDELTSLDGSFVIDCEEVPDGCYGYFTLVKKKFFLKNLGVKENETKM